MSPTPRRLLTTAAALVVLTAAPVVVPAAPVAAAPAAPVACDRFGALGAAGEVASGDLVELSGLAASHAHPGVLWANNDSGDTPRLFALDESGADLGTYAVEGADAIDWEDIAVGPGPEPGRSYVYIADIGDNAAARTDGVTVYRVGEPQRAPDGAGGTLAGVESVTLVYPDGPADAETLLIDPLDGDLVVLTKSLIGMSEVLTAPGDALADGATVALERVGTVRIPIVGNLGGLPGTMVTGGDVSPDGRWALLRTYQSVLAFERSGGDLAEAFLSPSCTAPAAIEAQGEAIAFTADGSAYLTASEVQGPIERGELPAGTRPALSRVAVTPPAAPATTTTLATTTTTVAPTTTAAPTTTLATTTTIVAATTTAPAVMAPAPPTSAGSAPTGTSPTTEPPSGDGGGSDRGSSPWRTLGIVLAVALIVGGFVMRRRGHSTVP